MWPKSASFRRLVRPNWYAFFDHVQNENQWRMTKFFKFIHEKVIWNHQIKSFNTLQLIFGFGSGFILPLSINLWLKGRITQQSSPERDESNAFSKNVFLASTEDKNLGTEPKFELIWSNGWKVIGPQFLLHTL
jgi:hypothetical protein